MFAYCYIQNPYLIIVSAHAYTLLLCFASLGFPFAKSKFVTSSSSTSVGCAKHVSHQLVYLAVEQFIVAYTEVVVIFFVVHGLLLLGGFGRLLVSVGGFEVGDYLLCEVYIIEVVGIVGKVDNKCVLRYARFFFL